MNGSKIASAEKLLIFDPSKAKTACDVFISSPTPEQEEKLGKLFIVAEIESSHEANQEIIKTINTEINKNFYNQDDFISIENSFEEALQKSNRRLPRMISQDPKEWLSKLNILIAVLKDNELHFTNLGSAGAFLIHGPRIVDIVAQTSPQKDFAPTPLKMFSNVISGNLCPQDSVLFTTANLLDYVSQEKLRLTIKENPPLRAVSEIDNLLRDVNPSASFAALVIKLVGQEVLKAQTQAPTPVTPQAPQASMETLRSQEETTGELITPSIWLNIKKGLSKYNKNLRSKISRKPSRFPESRSKSLVSSQSTLETPLSYKERYQPVGRESILKRALIGFLNIFKYILRGIIKSFIYLIDLIRDRRTRYRLKKLPSRIPQLISLAIVKFKRLPGRQKILLAASAIFIFLFAYSIVNLGVSQESKKKSDEFDQLLAKANDKVTEAQAAMIYENEDEARSLLGRARNFLNQLPSQAYKDNISTLNSTISSELDKINHLNIIESPKVAADFSVISQNIDPGKMALVDNKIYSFNLGDNTAFEIDLNDQKIETLSKPEIEEQLQMVVAPSSSLLTFLHSGDNLIELDLSDNSFQSKEISFLNENKDIEDIATYFGRIYLLDTNSSQVVRYDRRGDQYSKGANWITASGVDLSNASSLTVDGSVYVSKNDGQILKLFAGAPVEFKVVTFEPELREIKKIYTIPEFDNLFVLDAVNKRLIVLTKEGGLVNQYSSDKFDNLKDMVVSDDETKAYLLNGNKIYQIDLS